MMTIVVARRTAKSGTDVTEHLFYFENEVKILLLILPKHLIYNN